MEDAILSGIAGGFQGASEGLSRGIRDAQAIQSIESSRQDMAFKGDLMKRANAEEEKSHKPVGLDEIKKTVPPWALKHVEQNLLPYVQGKDTAHPYVETGDYKSIMSELNKGVLGKSQMALDGIQWHEDEIGKIDKQLQPLMQEANSVYAARMKAIEDAPDDAKKYDLKEKLKKDAAKGGKYYDQIQQLQQMSKQKEGLSSTRDSLRASIGKLNTHLETLMKESGVDENTAIMAEQGNEAAQQKVRKGRWEMAALKTKDTPDRMQIVEIPSADGKSATKYSVNVNTGEKTPIGQPYKVKSQVTNVNVGGGDKIEKKNDKDIKTAITGLRSFQSKNYTTPNKSDKSLTEDQIKANEAESMKVESIISGLQDGSLSIAEFKKYEWPTVVKDGRLLRKSSVQGGATAPAGFKDSGKTSGGKKVYVNNAGKAWVE